MLSCGWAIECVGGDRIKFWFEIRGLVIG